MRSASRIVMEWEWNFRLFAIFISLICIFIVICAVAWKSLHVYTLLYIRFRIATIFYLNKHEICIIRKYLSHTNKHTTNKTKKYITDQTNLSMADMTSNLNVGTTKWNRKWLGICKIVLICRLLFRARTSRQPSHSVASHSQPSPQAQR